MPNASIPRRTQARESKPTLDRESSAEVRGWVRELADLADAAIGRALLTPALLPILRELPDDLPISRDRRRVLAALRGAPDEVTRSTIRLDGWLHEQGLSEELLEALRDAAEGLPANEAAFQDVVARGAELAKRLARYQAAQEAARTLAARFDDPQALVRVREALEVLSAEATPQPKQEAYPLTDLGNARRLMARHGRELRYVPAWGTWLIWDGRRWAPDETGEVYRWAKEAAISILHEAAEASDDETRKELVRWAMSSQSAQRLRAMVSLAESEPGIPVRPAELDADPWLLNVLNGTLDLRTGELRPHRREDLITKLVPIEYRPDAACPRWEQFLQEVFEGDEGVIGFVRRAIGYSLTGNTREQVLFNLYGRGGNGKSVLLETLTCLLGDYARKADMSSFLVRDPNRIPNDIARLAGARLVTASESDEGRKFNAALVKALTGQDTIVARFLHREFFEFRPAFKVWLAFNHKPEVRDQTHAFWRRIRLIRFNVTFKDPATVAPDEPGPFQDRELSAKLRAELPGILAWAVRGCLEWQAQGLGMPEAVKAATEEYRAEMDVLAGFIAERCIVRPDMMAKSAELYAAYEAWCKENGEQPIKQRTFGVRLKERGFQPEHTKTARWWRGIGLREEVGDASDAVTQGDTSFRVFSNERGAYIEKPVYMRHHASPDSMRHRGPADGEECDAGQDGITTDSEMVSGVSGVLPATPPADAADADGWVEIA